MLKTKIGNLDLECCVYNASGPHTVTIQELSRLGPSKCGAILSKSSTVVKRNGNDKPRTLPSIKLGSDFCDGSLNSEGLPNMGFEYCEYHILLIMPLHSNYIYFACRHKS